MSVVEVSGLWFLKLQGLGGFGLGDRVSCWYDFGQGVNKSGGGGYLHACRQY